MNRRRSLLFAFLLLSNCLLAQVALAAGGLCLDVEVDGDVYLENRGDAEVSFDGYTLACETGCLDPQGWKSIARHVSEGKRDEVIAALGSGAVQFGEANPSPNALTELNLGGVGVARPGLRFYMGRPFKVVGKPASISFDASVSGATVRHTFCIPEPSAMFLAVIGVGVLLIRRNSRPI